MYLLIRITPKSWYLGLTAGFQEDLKMAFLAGRQRLRFISTLLYFFLKNENNQLSSWLKMKTEDLKAPVENVKKMKTTSCAGSPIFEFDGY